MDYKTLTERAIDFGDAIPALLQQQTELMSKHTELLQSSAANKELHDSFSLIAGKQLEITECIQKFFKQ